MLYVEIKSSEENLAFCCGLGTPTIVEPVSSRTLWKVFAP